MKHEVIEFFQNLPNEKHEQFNQAYKLYRESPHKNVGVERRLNAEGFSERALENLLYDLQKMHGITDVEKQPVDKADFRLQNADERLEVLETVVLLTPEDFPSFVDSLKDSKYDLENLLEFAVTSENEKATEVLKTIIEFSEKADEDKADFIAHLVSQISKKINAEILFIELKPVLEMADEDLFLWAHKRQEDKGDVHDLLDLAISQNAEKATEILTKAWNYIAEPQASLGGASDASNTDIQDNIDVKALVEENQNLQDEKDDLEIENEELKDENEALAAENEALKLAPRIDNQSIRVEFPFLNNADCPDEFKILIADKITAWNRYLELQEQIAGAKEKEDVSLDELARLGGEVVKCFDENQKIYDELNCYQTTGKVLGVHPVFKKLRLTREVEEMTNDELIKYKSSSAKYFSVNKTALEKAKIAKDDAKVLEIETRLSERHDKLFLVNKKLGV